TPASRAPWRTPRMRGASALVGLVVPVKAGGASASGTLAFRLRGMTNGEGGTLAFRLRGGDGRRQPGQWRRTGDALSKRWPPLLDVGVAFRIAWRIPRAGKPTRRPCPTSPTGRQAP